MATDVSDVQTITVGPDDAETRLDRWFKRHYPGLPFGKVAKLMRTGQVRVDGKRAKTNQRLRAGQEIRVPPLPGDATDPGAVAAAGASTAADPALILALQNAVLYRDDWVLALNKPPGIASQGGTHVGDNVDGLADSLRFGAPSKPRLVHRLDKDTSGALLLGRGPEAANRLGRAFRDHAAHKVYWALTAGIPAPRAGRIDRPLAKVKRGGGEKMGESADGKPAVTAYAVIATGRRRVCWVAVSPLTGRTHQIRAHLSLMGAPIVGDGKYGGRKAFPPGMESAALQLHAREIAVPHPDDGTTLRVTAPLPDHMEQAFKRLTFDVADGEDIDPISR